ncbi:lytic transglycosylase domain-containing protein [Leptospira kanakyensis]|uniref:Lytic transglycosylase domain-containing protein n=1 Tax=Leptospira kanakyensis TaxID=2484968 RepID=A0A6N4PTW2_9LEPT|nr:lytic transglycosylase domain-containing protein [Leptospira kanakyensis]TGK47950.1 lytic transglycosylase domain-containing protein [Leptospira kanakyensis]TGK63042.1 lytic transglycosylase domain-containing protein [Leptospira kanakyensis]TGK66648.1 lytic transglycosylase domain-containing protein [Leptospira kanakyensis]
MRHFWLASRILLFFTTSLFAETDLQYLIKSHQWGQIENHFRNTNPSRESEVYSLIEFHEKSPNGDKEKRFRYLISLVRGVFVTESSEEEVRKILTQTMPFQTTIFKLSYWKLYTEITQRNYLTPAERIQYLNRLNLEEDPICRRLLDELVRLLAANNQWKDILDKINSVQESHRRYLLTGDTQYRYGKAKLILGDEKAAVEEWLSLLQRDGLSDSTVHLVAADWSKYKGSGSILQLAPSELTLLLPAISNNDKEALFRTRPELFSTRLAYYEGFKHLASILTKTGKINELFRVLRANKTFVDMDSAYIVSLADILYQQNKFQNAIELLKTFPGKDAGYYRVLAATYDRLGDREMYFENLILYLGKYPFNLFYQDRLIEYLVDRKGEKSNYAPLAKFERALAEIPNLPVKGRLVYWYLRALKENGETDKLKKELKRYYALCPGSYYTRVIREEFLSLIKEGNKPDNPTYNKEYLFEYLSYTAGIPEESYAILGRNLGFVYPKDSYELGNKLGGMSSRIQGHKLLNLAKEYFRLGEDSLGLGLVSFHVKRENLSEEEKDEILVGIGDLTYNTYYTAFHTRSLLKRHLIPDDPILLPTSLSVRMYPRPHQNIVSRYAQENDISEDKVYALMRQESFFKETATSRSNARGLMQIMPATGKELASRLGITSYSLYEPETSIRLGTKFLAYLLKSNGNELKWASIAYNGGPGNLRKWKKSVYTGDFNHFLEDLPYKESRDYCRIVVSNFYAYDIMKKYHKL